MLVVFHSNHLMLGNIGMKTQKVDTHSYSYTVHFLQQNWNSQTQNHLWAEQVEGTIPYLHQKNCNTHFISHIILTMINDSEINIKKPYNYKLVEIQTRILLRGRYE